LHNPVFYVSRIFRNPALRASQILHNPAFRDSNPTGTSYFLFRVANQANSVNPANLICS
jgi:hypothetical protein